MIVQETGAPVCNCAKFHGQQKAGGEQAGKYQDRKLLKSTIFVHMSKNMKRNR